MLRLFIGWVVVLLLVGCSSKKEQALVDSYTKKNTYHKNLQRTEKVELYDGNMSVAMLTATHMYTPNFDKNDTRDEVFIVSVAFEEPEISRLRFDINSTSTNENEYALTLNKKKAKKVLHLESDDKKLKNVSFVTSWGEYYEVTFPHAGTKFSLEFASNIYGKGKLNFSKVPKFVYTNKGF